MEGMNTGESRTFSKKAYEKAKDYEKIVFGQIVKVWRKKN